MGRFFDSHEKKPLRVPPAADSKAGSPTIGQQKASNPKQGRNRKIILISVCSVAVVLLISIIVSVWYFVGWPTDDGLILNNVMVSGINLGGMTREQAEEAIRKATDDTYTKQNMVVELPDVTMTFTPADTGAKLDVQAVVDEAYDYGRKGSYDEREAAKEAALSTTHHIPLLPYLNLDLEYIKNELMTYGESFNSTYEPSAVEFDIEKPVLDAADEKFDPKAPCQIMKISLGRPGRALDMTEVYNKVLDAYSFNQFHVSAQMKEAEKIPEVIDLEALFAEHSSEAVDSYLDPEDCEIIPEVYGYNFDLEKALLQMEQAKYGDTLEIPFRFLLPEVMGEDLAKLLFRDILCEYKTEHTTDSNRNTNLTLACAAINGTILMPGETFDYNTVVGKRTAAKGYKNAAAYSSGKTVQTIGGGVCQVSSTIYYCCLIADLEIVTRSPHSYVSSYMPMGMDATVSWGGPEFAFKNSTNYPIRIETWVADGYVHCKLVGTDEKDYYVEMRYETIGSESPETIYEEYAPDNAEGYRDGEVIQTSYKGWTVRTYKMKYDKETKELISEEEDRVSRYKKRDKIIAKIIYPTEPPTDPPAPKPTDPPVVTPTPTPTDPPANPAPDSQTPPAEGTGGGTE